MKVAAITITYNRLELTKRTVESFYSNTSVDYHLFIDNGSTDGTQEYLKGFDHILLEKNFGIAYALATAVNSLEGYDYILKLDNDVETVTEDIINRMLDFHSKSGDKYVCSPIDLMLDKNFAPPVLWKGNLNGFHVQHVSHTGGAFQLMPGQICRELCKEFRHLAKGDYMIGHYYRKRGYKPTYLTELEINHIGLNQSTPGGEYKM
jgi:GT2 family glycosyltransferase